MATKNQNERRFLEQAAALTSLALCGLGVLLTGCGTSSSVGDAAAGTVVSNGLHISGIVHGGQQPVSGATIQLYAVGTTGNGSAATALLTPAVTTNASGSFSITGLYSCSANSLVYLTATQGNPGLGTGVNNTALAAMAALGSCATLKASAATTYISVNEVTTVGAVYALSAFMSDYAQVGYATGNLSGITNAFATANALVATGSGSAPGLTPGIGISFPTTLIYTLADAISACINSAGPTSAGCSTLFAAATPSGGTAPTNTVAAVANIAHNPAANVAAIYGLVTAAAPFQPALAAAPADFTMSIYYTGGGLALPNGIAIDSLGNAWVANEGGNAVTEIAAGTFASGTSGYTSTSIVGPQGIAIDGTGKVWLANTGADDVLELNSGGGVVGSYSTGVSGPLSIAIDGNQNVWVTNFDGNSIAEFSNTGTPASGSPFTTAALSGPTGLAIDASNRVWVGNGDGASVMLFNNSGVYQNAFTDGLLIAPGGVVTDTAHSRVWTAATGINAITGLTSSGGAVAGTPLATGGVMTPLSVAIDGAGSVWTVNNATAGTVSGFTTAGVAISPTAGFGLLNLPVGVALDASGNLWATDAGDSSVTEFIGLASPTVTPLVSSAR